MDGNSQKSISSGIAHIAHDSSAISGRPADPIVLCRVAHPKDGEERRPRPKFCSRRGGDATTLAPPDDCSSSSLVGSGVCSVQILLLSKLFCCTISPAWGKKLRPDLMSVPTTSFPPRGSHMRRSRRANLLPPALHHGSRCRCMIATRHARHTYETTCWRAELLRRSDTACKKESSPIPVHTLRRIRVFGQSS